MSRPAILDRAVTVVLTSVGNEAIHGFAHDLRRRAYQWRLVGTDIRGDAAGLARCDQGFLVPRRDAPGYLETLTRLCRRVGADLLLPLSTEDQDLFCRPEVQDGLGLPIVVSSPEAVAAANGKISLFAALAELPELLPDHRTVGGPRAAIQALDELIGRHGAALLKTDRGAGGAGMLCVGRPPSDPSPVKGRTWLDLEAAREAVERAPESSWPRQAVAWLPGREYSVDLLGDRGEPLGGAVRLRRSAVGGMALEAETVDEPEVLRAAERILAELGLSYVNNIQLRRDAGGAPRLMEINPRIPGTIGLTVEAGLNLPLAACCLALGVRLALPRPEIGLRVLRYAGALYTRRRFEGVSDAGGHPFLERGFSPGPPSPETSHVRKDPLGESLRAARSAQPEPLPRSLPRSQGGRGAAVLWDLDRTLLGLEISREDIGLWKDRLRERLAPLGWRGELSPLLPSLEAALDELAERRPPAELLRLRDEIYADLDRWEIGALRQVTPIEGALGRLRALAEAGVPSAVVTNSGPGIVALGLEVIAEWFEARGGPPPPLTAIYRHPLVRAKPSPAMLAAALSALSPAAVVAVVGDSPHDEAAARALGRILTVPVTFIEARDGQLRATDRGLNGWPRLKELLLERGVEKASR